MKSIFLLLFCLTGILARSQWRLAFSGTDDLNQARNAFFLSPSTGYVVTNNWIGFTTDSGHSFQRRYVTFSNVDYNLNSVNLTFGFTPDDVHAFSVDTLVVSGEYGWEPTVLYSTNGGMTWKVVFHRHIQLNGISLINSLYKLDFPGNGSTGYGIHGDQVIKTIDRGKSWQVVLTDANQRLFDLAFSNGSVGFAAGPNRLWRTTNGGISWSGINNFNFTINTISAFGNYIFINTEEGNNYYSNNQGGSWTQANTSSEQRLFQDMVYVNDSTGFGGESGIYKTTNRGKIWELMENVQANGSSYYISKLFMLNDQQGWACMLDESLLITSNGGGGTYPRALFTINNSTVCQDDSIRLVNQGATGNSYRWFRNNILFATTYNANFKIAATNDEIKLIATNAFGADTMVTVVNATATGLLTLNSAVRRDTVCSGTAAIIDILDSRADVLYRVGRTCCGNAPLMYGNGSTLSFSIGISSGQDSTFNVSATLSNSCGVQTASAQHTVHIMASSVPVTAVSDTICTQNTFYIKITNSKSGWKYWADASFTPVDGTGGLILLPCKVNSRLSAVPIDELLTRYRFEIFVRHARQYCGGTVPAATVEMIGRNPQAIFDIGGYEWLTGTNLLFTNTSRQSESYVWTFPDGSNLATSIAPVPTNINFTTSGYKTVKLVATTKEGCTDSTSKIIELIYSTGVVAVETPCAGSLPGNAIDTLKGSQYFVNRALYEDEYGNRIVAGGFTHMTDLYHFYPRGYEGWYAAKYNKNGEQLWRVQQNGGDVGTYNQNTHIIVEHAVGDKFGYTYLLGHFLNRSLVAVEGQETFAPASGGMFIAKISPAGGIIWTKSFSNGSGANYTGGTLLMGNNNDLYVVTSKDGQAYSANGSIVYQYGEGQSGVILQLNREGAIVRKTNLSHHF